MMKRKKKIILLTALFVAIGIIYVITTIRPEEVAPEEVAVGLPCVGVDGNKFVYEDNKIVMLMGVSIADSYACMHLQYMEDKNLSWIAWCFHPVWKPNMIKNWNFELTEEGGLVKQALVANSTLPTVLSKIYSNEATVE